jgi:hypothetical protein
MLVGYSGYAGWQAGYAVCAGWLVMMAMLPGSSGMLCGCLFWLAILDVYAGILASYSGTLAMLNMLAIIYMLAEYPACLSWLCC